MLRRRPRSACDGRGVPFPRVATGGQARPADEAPSFVRAHGWRCCPGDAAAPWSSRARAGAKGSVGRAPGRPRAPVLALGAAEPQLLDRRAGQCSSTQKEKRPWGLRGSEARFHGGSFRARCPWALRGVKPRVQVGLCRGGVGWTGGRGLCSCGPILWNPVWPSCLPSLETRPGCRWSGPSCWSCPSLHHYILIGADAVAECFDCRASAAAGHFASCLGDPKSGAEMSKDTTPLSQAACTN